jgi:hypothetical protein
MRWRSLKGGYEVRDRKASAGAFRTATLNFLTFFGHEIPSPEWGAQQADKALEFFPPLHHHRVGPAKSAVPSSPAKEPMTMLDFPPKTVSCFVRIIHTGSDKGCFWSFNEMAVYGTAERGAKTK